MICFACSACRKMLKVPESLAGRKVSCPQCGRRQAIPVEVVPSVSEAEPELLSSEPASPPRSEPAVERPLNVITAEALQPPLPARQPLAAAELVDHVEVVDSEAEAVKAESRIPRWLFVLGGLGIVACGILCGAAVGVWAYVLGSGYIAKNSVNQVNTIPANNFPLVEDPFLQPARRPANARHVEVQGGFSFVPPPGWKIQEAPGLKYHIVIGPAGEGFPNINCADEIFAGSLKAYVQANINHMKLTIEALNILGQEDFKTSEGLKGIRLIVESKQRGQIFRQTLYFFGKGNKKFVLACTALQEGGERFDPIFEASMKSFRFDKP